MRVSNPGPQVTEQVDQADHWQFTENIMNDTRCCRTFQNYITPQIGWIEIKFWDYFSIYYCLLALKGSYCILRKIMVYSAKSMLVSKYVPFLELDEPDREPVSPPTKSTGMR